MVDDIIELFNEGDALIEGALEQGMKDGTVDKLLSTIFEIDVKVLLKTLRIDKYDRIFIGKCTVPLGSSSTLIDHPAYRVYGVKKK